MDAVVHRRRRHSLPLPRRHTEGSKPLTTLSSVPEQGSRPLPIGTSYASEFRRLASSSSTPAMRGNLAVARRALSVSSSRATSRPESPAFGGKRPASASCRRPLSSPSPSYQVLENARAKRSISKSRSDADVQSADLNARALMWSRNMMLDFHEVKAALKALDETPTTGSLPNGGLDFTQFRSLLLRVFDVNHVPDEHVASAYSQCNASAGPLDTDTFFHWYRNNIFTFVSAMTAAGDAYQSHTMVQDLAKKFGTSPVELDRIKAKFDLFDLDKSGFIEFDEFEAMMLKLLKSGKADLPRNRMQRFWQEIDKDGSGSVDFEEFTEWWLKYFSLSSAAGPVEAFYASFMPDVQRSNNAIAEAEKEEKAMIAEKQRNSLLHLSQAAVR
eukprot:TRINITY_DN107501_c0_g1_i1.p1 TRINITY_DN107501_c0_g1~~TRINITY_DN107501_c0_g1_i1.p1  ORF type:complete len:386 (-),score=83.67 TRINITY_DN107501_c0_g1_i1:65-1222(-)